MSTIITKLVRLQFHISGERARCMLHPAGCIIKDTAEQSY